MSNFFLKKPKYLVKDSSACCSSISRQSDFFENNNSCIFVISMRTDFAVEYQEIKFNFLTVFILKSDEHTPIFFVHNLVFVSAIAYSFRMRLTPHKNKLSLV